MDINSVNTHITTSASGKTLSGGSFIYVKVLSHNGDDRYTVSAGGTKVDVRSKIHLEPGSNFKAIVKTDSKGTILLIPETANQSNIITKQQILQNGVPGPQLATFLQNNGIFPDSAAVRVLMFLQQSGMKTDTTLIKKAQFAASAFPKRINEASEISILLLEKGINPDPKLIQKILDSKDNNFSESEKDENNDSSQNEHNNQNTEQKNHSDNQQEQASSKQDNKQNRNSTFSKDQFGIFFNEMPNKKGLLSFMNQLSNNTHHWIFLPYEWNIGENRYTGIIRLLLDLETHNVEKIEINCKTSMTKYFFVIYLNVSKVKEIRFCTLPPLLPSSFCKEELRLGELFRSGMNLDSTVTVAYSTSALTSGFCINEEPPVCLG